MNTFAVDLPQLGATVDGHRTGYESSQMAVWMVRNYFRK